MKKVFLLLASGYEHTNILGIYSSESLAEENLAKFVGDDYEWYQIDEVTVDLPVWNITYKVVHSYDFGDGNKKKEEYTLTETFEGETFGDAIKELYEYKAECETLESLWYLDSNGSEWIEYNGG